MLDELASHKFEEAPVRGILRVPQKTKSSGVRHKFVN